MKEKSVKSKSKYDEHFERMDATPEQLTEALFRISPQKLKEWWVRKKIIS